MTLTYLLFSASLHCVGWDLARHSSMRRVSPGDEEWGEDEDRVVLGTRWEVSQVNINVASY